MRNNKLFKKTVRSALAVAAFALLATATPAVAHAEEASPVNEEIQDDTPAEKPAKNPVQYYPIGWINIPLNWNDLVVQDTPAEAPVELQTTQQEDAPVETQANSTTATHEEHSHVSENTVQTETASADASVEAVNDDLVDPLVKEIVTANTEAQQSGTIVTLYHNDLTSLSLPVMKTLQACPNVILDMTYTYNGVSYHTAVTGGASVICDDSVSTYGPTWLFDNYGVR